MNSERYNGLDALRVVSSFGVVFLHVYVSAGSPSALEWFVKLRDFALPVMVMSSFFVLTTSLARKPENGFAGFFRRSLKRLWLPLFVWTLIYILFAGFAVPFFLGVGAFGELPSPIILFTGYRHLWYLQFIFVSSLLIYPLVFWLSRKKKSSPMKLAGFCFAAAIGYGFLFYSFIKNYTAWDSFAPEADMNLRIFVEQASHYIFYIPLAVGCGLLSDKIKDWFECPFFRRLSLAFVFIALAAHLGASGVLLTREIFGAAVFLAALQPWGKIRSQFWRLLAAHSYPIYILHFFGAQILWVFVAHKNFEPDWATVFGIAVAVYFASFAAAVLIRKSFPAEWLLPLVAVDSEKERQNPASENTFRSGSRQSRSTLLELSPFSLRENTGEK